MKRALSLSCLAALATSALVVTAGSPASASPEASDIVFTIDKVLAAVEPGLAREGTPARTVGAPPAADQLGLAVVELDDQIAAVDYSLVRDGAGAVSAATSDYIDLSWTPMDGVSRYAVARGEELLGTTETPYFRYSEVAPGEVVDFRVSAITADDSAEFTRTYGLRVAVPEAAGSQGEAARAQVENSVAAALKYTNSSIYWYTFIPMARIDAPPVGVPGLGCEYSAGYQFGGDNRGFADSVYDVGGKYRTMLAADVYWGRAEAVEPWPYGIGRTTVYKDGSLVDSRQLDVWDTIHEAKQLMIDPAGAWVDIRMSQQAGMPYCEGNSIAGAFTITLTRSGSWVITSGSHRQMPNHEIFLRSTISNGTITRDVQTPVYRREYADPLCLISWACPEAQMGGYQGGY